MKNLYKLFLITLLLSSPILAQVTGLSGWNIYIDQGHSQIANMGIYGYSESEKVLRVGLRLQELLMNTTDIDTAYVCRTNDQMYVGLSQRTTQANNLGAAWYHSIHSNAGGSSANNTLMLWGQLYNGTPDPPVGGEAMSAIMLDLLTRGYRIPTIGSWGDCSFYGTCSSSFPGPYLHVNRTTNMPSELSEAGFHTNPTQNQRNMNAEWKKLEAYTFYWSILEYFGIARPAVGIATGIISDMDSNVPINGAIVTINGQAYTTDTFASLFHQYTSDPDLLHNGFYYIENLPNSTLEMTIEAPDYYSDTIQVTIVDTFFTFANVNLISSLSPTVTYTIPADGDTNFSGYDRIIINFSRKMNKPSVENAFSLNPATSGSFIWADNKKVIFTPDSLLFLTNYTLTIAGTAEDIYGHSLDGDGNGVGGDDFIMSFKTGPSDIFAPQIVSHYPNANQNEVDIWPIINILYDEELDSSTVADSLFDFASVSNIQNSIPGFFEHRALPNPRSLPYYPSISLDPADLHRTKLLPAFEDLLGNRAQYTNISVFTTTDYEYTPTEIDDFEGSSISSNWWDPSQSGSTAGIGPGTGRSENTDYVNHLTGSSKSLQINYEWNTTVGNWLIREYLSGGSPRNVLFNNTYHLQVYIFGDGSGNKFRFCVDDGVGGGSAGHEVSPWYTIDWFGWRLVSWDMANDPVGTWIGNGVLNGTLRFDSIQLTYEPGASSVGTLYFDDLRIATKNPLGLPENDKNISMPTHYQLFQNYPNPFNPSTIIKYQIPKSSNVKIKVYDMLGKQIRILVNGHKSAGIYQVDFHTENLAAGIYLYTIEADGFRDTKKMMLVK